MKVRKVHKELLKHASLSIEACEMLIGEIACAVEGDREGVMRHQAGIKDLEERGDRLRRDLERVLSEGVMFAAERSAFITMVEKMDKLLDRIDQAGRVLFLREPTEEALSAMRELEVEKYAGLLLDEVKALKNAVDALYSNYREAIRWSYEVEKGESAVDEMKIEMLRTLYTMDDRLDVLSILQIEKLIAKIDDASDAAEDASDAILLIASKTLP